MRAAPCASNCGDPSSDVKALIESASAVRFARAPGAALEARDGRGQWSHARPIGLARYHRSAAPALGGCAAAAGRARQPSKRRCSEIEEFTAKLENGRVEIAAFGEVGSGKSALLNALAGEQFFAVSAEHGSTDKIAKTGLQEHQAGPGRHAGHQRSGRRTARQARRGNSALHRPRAVRRRRRPQPRRSRRASTSFSDLHKPIVLVINKADLFGPAQIKEISESILRKVGQPHRRRRYRIRRCRAARDRARNPQGRRHHRDRAVSAEAKDRGAGSAHARSARPRGQGDHRAQRQPVRDRRQRADQAS